MKKRNLFLSLISSVLVAVAIITVTICTVVAPKKNNDDNSAIVTPISDVVEETDYESINEFERNGSAELPYIIYSTDSFVNLLTKYGSQQRVITTPVMEKVEKDGEWVDEYKRDSNGHMIFEEVLDDNGNKTYGVYNFEFANDIDFAGIEYTTLFNDGTSLIANIDGKDYSLKNITINVNTENLESNYAFAVSGKRYSHIGIFGNINGAEIKNMKISNIDVNVDADVYDFIADAQYVYRDGAFKEFTVGSVAAIAKNAKFVNVELDASVDASAYAVTSNNAIGGFVGVGENLTIKNSKINVDIFANAGTDYLVGGIAGYGRTATVKDTKVNVNFERNNEGLFNMAGMFAYARVLEAVNVDVVLYATETTSTADRQIYVDELLAKDSIDATSISKIAGLVCALRANDNSQESTIKNVTVKSEVDFDVIFAGAILDVYSENKANTSVVDIEDVTVVANANTLAIHGFARQLVAANVSYSDALLDAEGYVNLKITGSAKLTSYVESVNFNAVTIFVATEKKYYAIDGGFDSLQIEVSSAIANSMCKLDKTRLNAGTFGSFEII